MVSVSSSRLSTGSRTERSTTSLIASRFLERCDPFWSGGRSTNKSRVVVNVSVRLGRRTWTGFTTPVTPTLLSRNEFVTFSPCTSFGMGSTRGALPSRRLKTCRSDLRIRGSGTPRILPPCYRGVPGGPFAHDLHDDFAVPGFVVELEEDDLLPRPQFDAAVDDRDREARSEERGADVAVAVSVVPPALVPVLDRRRAE